jgi:2-polyprenyl-6-methoxyphenol hydroxylase-like FAD-dependent oxidoreductase
MAHQPPTYPILSRVPGLLPELIAAGSLSTGLCFRTSVANGSRVIAEKRFDNAGAGIKGKGQLLLPQGAFQEILMARLSARPGVDVRVGWRVTSFTSSTAATASVHVATANHAGHTRDVEATYLIGADGAHSLVRTHLGLPFDGATLSAQLVACDIRYPFAAHDFHDANFIIDPADYGLVGRILPATATAPALWRVSYGVPAGEDEDRVRDGVHEKLSRMLPGLDIAPADYEVVRVAPYTPHQRLASTLYTDRVCLVGDAAHLTNPYAGLGLASGIADTSALADVLSRILTSRASDPEKLLGEWSAARRQVFLDVVDKPSRAAYARVRSDVSSEEKMAELIGRDRLVGALKKGMPVLPGSLETRGEDLEGW